MKQGIQKLLGDFTTGDAGFGNGIPASPDGLVIDGSPSCWLCRGGLVVGGSPILLALSGRRLGEGRIAILLALLGQLGER